MTTELIKPVTDDFECPGCGSILYYQERVNAIRITPVRGLASYDFEPDQSGVIPAPILSINYDREETDIDDVLESDVVCYTGCGVYIHYEYAGDDSPELPTSEIVWRTMCNHKQPCNGNENKHDWGLYRRMANGQTRSIEP